MDDDDGVKISFEGNEREWFEALEDGTFAAAYEKELERALEWAMKAINWNGGYR